DAESGARSRKGIERGYGDGQGGRPVRAAVGRGVLMRQRICIIGYSPIHRDARILRQIEYLSPDYDLTVIAHGEPVAAFPDVTWRFVPRANRFENLLTLVFLAAARLLPFLYETWYWQKRRNRLALR